MRSEIKKRPFFILMVTVFGLIFLAAYVVREFEITFTSADEK